MRQPIPDELRRFILPSIPSVPFLEAVLLVRAEPRATWDAGRLAHRLYIPQHRADELLTQLAEAGFVRREAPGLPWGWHPGHELAGLVDQLAEHYSDNLVGVTELIHSRQERRAMQFADAFRLRRKED